MGDVRLNPFALSLDFDKLSPNGFGVGMGFDKLSPDGHVLPSIPFALSLSKCRAGLRLGFDKLTPNRFRGRD